MVVRAAHKCNTVHARTYSTYCSSSILFGGTELLATWTYDELRTAVTVLRCIARMFVQ